MNEDISLDAQCHTLKRVEKLHKYSSLSNNRAGWNKRAGRKICPILGNLKSLNTCGMDISYFK